MSSTIPPRLIVVDFVSASREEWEVLITAWNQYPTIAIGEGFSGSGRRIFVPCFHAALTPTPSRITQQSHDGVMEASDRATPDFVKSPATETARRTRERRSRYRVLGHLESSETDGDGSGRNVGICGARTTSSSRLIALERRPSVDVVVDVVVDGVFLFIFIFCFTWTYNVLYFIGFRVPFLLDYCYYLALFRAVLAPCACGLYSRTTVALSVIWGSQRLRRPEIGRILLGFDKKRAPETTGTVVIRRGRAQWDSNLLFPVQSLGTPSLSLLCLGLNNFFWIIALS